MGYSTIQKKKCFTCKKDLPENKFYHTIKRGKPYIRNNCIECENKKRGNIRMAKITPIRNLRNEKWVTLFDGKYQLSNKGRVKIFTRKYSFSLANNTINSTGYCVVSININGNRYNKTLHRLLAQNFIPNPNNYPTVNHKNGIKTDNRLANLEWCSYAYNNEHARKTGLNKGCRGEKIHTAKLNKSQVMAIFKSNATGIELAKKYNVSVWCISCIKTGERWSHITGKIYIKRLRKTKNAA